jgi:tetratricopeptide (TPR) repeat protein
MAAHPIVLEPAGMRRALLLLSLALACSRSTPEVPAPAAGPKPSILLVTLDTTRADAIGANTPVFNALAARGLRFRYAYATVPQTLPSHSSMFTGLYPAGHGVHENARPLDEKHPVIAERLREAGYRTAAFVSAFALARRFGLARGFDVYDEEFGAGRAERTAKETTDLAVAYLNAQSPQPLFLWVHYYDPHYPWTPSYAGEVAAMDQQMGRLIQAFEKQGTTAVVVVADHGEGLGEHGEQQHGNLLYQSTMHVPLTIVGPGVTPGVRDGAVTTRRIYHTLLDLAGIDATNSLRTPTKEIVMGEAMKPFLDYGWQPQVMAVEESRKAILAGRPEMYDVVADPGEKRDLAGSTDMSREVRAALREYPLPTTHPVPSTANLDDEARRKLASLGYIASTAQPVIRSGAPRPADMTPLFRILDRAAGLFVAEQYAEAVPLLEQILATDPNNLDAALRLATAHSSLGHDAQALTAFRRAEAIAPTSIDVRTYLALHLARGKEWQTARPMLEKILAETPNKVPAIEALAVVREREGNLPQAIALRQKLYTLRAPSAGELVVMGGLAMQIGQTLTALDALERARSMQGPAFQHDLELGVLYLATGRLPEARAALDRVSPAHPGYAMALFKRAQVSVLLKEDEAPARIAAARKGADKVTRELIERERLFR